MPLTHTAAPLVVSLPRNQPRQKRLPLPLTLICALASTSFSLHAADVTVQPSAGSGFVVKDAAGANERLRVQESGAISLPAVPAAPAQSQGLCMSASGQLGPCSGGTGGSYTAATGLTLTGTTFAVAPTYRLPQTCAANQIAQWNGTAWDCGNVASTNLPTGTVNQTLRYDTGNALVANPLLQAFSDGGLLAGSSIGTGGNIPTTGPGIRLMWYPGKAAFRAGRIESIEWDDAYIGAMSMATGNDTMASGRYSTALGEVTRAMGESSTAMGHAATASGDSSTAMGFGTTAGGDNSTAMGEHTTASSRASTAMGYRANATGGYSTAMGYRTTASNSFSTAMGFNTTASGYASTAMGSDVDTAGHVGSFIYGDYAHTGTVANTSDNQFLVLAYGGVQFFTGEDPISHALTQGVALAPGGGSWTTICDRNAKTAVMPVDGLEVLKKVAELPLNTWQYKAQEAKYRHMGPMAQDFYTAFQLGESDKGIDTVDADGVALAAIQGLNSLLAELKMLFNERDAKISARLDEKDREIMALRAELQAQKTEIAAQKARFAEFESLAGDLVEMKARLGLQKSHALATTARPQTP